MPTNFPPPVNVSPLIRFGRYSMLLVGLGYGTFWQSRYTKKELALKDIKAKEKAARDARIAQEKARRSADEYFIAVPNEIDKDSYADAESYDKQMPFPNNSEQAEQSDKVDSAVEPDEIKERLPTNEENILEPHRSFNFSGQAGINSEEQISNINVTKQGSSESVAIKVEDVKHSLPRKSAFNSEHNEKKNTLHNTNEEGTNIPIMGNANIFDNISHVESVKRDVKKTDFSESHLHLDQRKGVNTKIFDTPENLFSKDTDPPNSSEIKHDSAPHKLLDGGDSTVIVSKDIDRYTKFSTLQTNNDQGPISEENEYMKNVYDDIPNDNYVDFLFSHGPS